MAAVVMDDLQQLDRLAHEARRMPGFDRLVMQLRFADGLSRAETSQVLDVEPASVLAAEMRVRAWVALRSAATA